IKFARRRLEIIRLGSQPDSPLVGQGRYILERMTGADMRNANNMMLARNELLRSMAEKEEFIRNYREM
nr:kinesin motor domain-containing protein [Tanacetum cinerariifolium]